MVAAGELAAKGHDVTLFEAGELGGKAGLKVSGSVTLDTGPTLLTMPSVVRTAFERLGALDLLPAFYEVDPQCEYSFASGAHLTAHRDVRKTAAAASALGPAEESGVHTFYQEAAALYRFAGKHYLETPFEGPGSFLARAVRQGPSAILRGLSMGTLHQLAMQHFKTPEMQQFVGRFATYAGASPYNASAAFALIPHLEQVLGTHHVRGGIGELAKALRVALTRLGVRFMLGARASWTRVGSRYRVGARGDERDFDAVVVNADPLASLSRSREPLAMSAYVLLVETDRRLKLPHHSVLFGDNDAQEFQALFSGRLPSDPTVYVCHPAATDPSMASDGESGLYFMVNVPALAGPADWEVEAKRLRQFVIDRLEERFPQVRGTHYTILGERSPVDFARDGAPRGSLYGFLPHGRLGPFRRPRQRGKTPGLFYAGGGTHPGGGVPLVLLSGRFAAAMADDALRCQA